MENSEDVASKATELDVVDLSTPRRAIETASLRARRELTTLWAQDRLEAGLLLALAAGLAWAPFWLGGNRPLPWGVNAVLFPGLVIIYEGALLARGRHHPVGLRETAAPAALFFSVVLWVLFQISPYAPSPVAHPIWSMASDALGASLPATVSVNPTLSLLALVRLISDAAVFWLAMQLGRKPERAIFLLKAIAAIGAAYAVYGLFLAAFFNARIPLFDVTDWGGAVRANFVNRNSFATYVGMSLIVSMALTLRLYRHSVSQSEGLASFRIAKLLEVTGRRGALLVGLTLLLAVALLGTVSRGGILASALGVLALFVMSFSRRRRGSGERVEALAFVAAAAVAVFVFFGDRIVGRIASAGLADASRMSVDLIVIRALGDAPLLGFGYGTFADVFPMYRDQSIPTFGIWEYAHNTYLEVLLGLGLVFGAALIGSIAWVWVRCLIGAVKRRRDATAPVVACAVGLTVGVHALADFSIQMEGVAVTFAAILGLGFAQSESSVRAVSD